MARPETGTASVGAPNVSAGSAKRDASKNKGIMSRESGLSFNRRSKLRDQGNEE